MQLFCFPSKIAKQLMITGSQMVAAFLDLIVNRISLGIGLLVGKKRIFEESEKLGIGYFFTVF